jgi:hypothetical protein
MSTLDLSFKTHLTRFIKYSRIIEQFTIFTHAVRYLTYVVSLAQPRLRLYFVITTVTYMSTQLYGDTASGHCLVCAGVTKLRFYFIP